MGIQRITVRISFDEKIDDFDASMLYSELENIWSVNEDNLRREPLHEVQYSHPNGLRLMGQPSLVRIMIEYRPSLCYVCT